MSLKSEATALDRLVSVLVGMGVPGLILLVAMAATGWAGAAAITAALSTLGPGGMVGGVCVLVASGLISAGLAKFGFRKVFEATVRGILEKGMSKQEILNKVERYPITKDLKLRIKDLLDHWDDHQSGLDAALVPQK